MHLKDNSAVVDAMYYLFNQQIIWNDGGNAAQVTGPVEQPSRGSHLTFA